MNPLSCHLLVPAGRTGEPTSKRRCIKTGNGLLGTDSTPQETKPLYSIDTVRPYAPDAGHCYLIQAYRHRSDFGRGIHEFSIR